jgi:hypothetical protein
MLAAAVLLGAISAAPAKVITTHDHNVADAENADAMSVCELAYATARLIEVSDPADYGSTISARSVHALTPSVPLKSSGPGLGWLVGASASDPNGNFTYRIVCASATGDLFRLVVVDQFEQFTVQSETGTWTGPNRSHGTWSGSTSGGRFVISRG